LVESLFAINTLTSIKRLEPLCNLFANLIEPQGSELILFFEKTQCLTHDFTGRVVKAALDLILDDFL
jgi:hypothetical protein